MRRCMLFLLLLPMGLNINAQTVLFDGNDFRDFLFSQSVKSCDEFMCRFNEEEFFPFPDLDRSNPLLGKRNFLCLFDFTISQIKGEKAFIEEVSSMYDTVKDNNVKLSFESDKWYSELRAIFRYKKKKVELGLVFHAETTPKGLPCWTLVGVNGLEKIGFIKSEEHLVVSPEQNESEFMEIDGDFKRHSKEFSKFRGYNSKLDGLSYFFALVESGTLIFDQRLYCIYHFFDVPSYYFEVKYCSRKSANNGWLITDFKKVTEEERNGIKIKILGL